jgi:hypothetical protein
VDGNCVWLAEHLRFFLVDIRFTVAPHDIAGAQGSWRLTPIADGRHTLLTYRARIDTGRHIPVFIEQALLQRSLPNVIAGIRDEVERRTYPP